MGKNNFRVAINLVLMQDNKVLLMRRANTGWNDGMYALMGGHVEDAENPIDAVVREAKEELGIDVKPENLRPLLTMAVSPDHIYLYFGCDSWDGKVVNNEPEECDDVRFFDTDNLPQNLIGADKEALDLIFKNSQIRFHTYGYSQPTLGLGN